MRLPRCKRGQREPRRPLGLSYQGHRVAGLVAECLADGGFEAHDEVGATGVVGTLRRGDGPCCHEPTGCAVGPRGNRTVLCQRYYHRGL